MRGHSSRLKKGEFIAPVKGAKNVPHLCREDGPIEFILHDSAKKAANRVGGVAYKSPTGSHYLVKFER